MPRILYLLPVLALAACASLDPMPAQYAETQYIVELPGNSPQQIFARSQQWAAETFVDSNEAVKYASEEEGKIIAKGLGSISDMVTRYFSYTLVIDIKQDKARLTFKDVEGVRLRGIHPPSFGLDSQRAKAFKRFKELKTHYMTFVINPKPSW